MAIDVRQQKEKILEIRPILIDEIVCLTKEAFYSLNRDNKEFEKSYLIKNISGFVDADLCGVKYKKLNKVYKRHLAGKSKKFNNMMVDVILRKIIKNPQMEKSFIERIDLREFGNLVDSYLNEDKELEIDYKYHFLPKSIEKCNNGGKKYFNVLCDLSVNISFGSRDL